MEEDEEDEMEEDEKDEEDEEEHEDEEEDEEDEEDPNFDFNFFKAKLKKTFGDDRDFANKMLQKYEPTLSMKKIKGLSNAKFFSALADIMCHEEE